MDSKLIAVLSVAIAALVGISIVEATTNVAVCKNDPPQFISCPAQSTINIIDIVYGRKRNKCGVQWHKSCRSRTAERMTRNDCQGKRYCVIYGYRDGYGNPCSFPGDDEYMDVTYECVAYVCEGMYALVNCAGKGVIDVRSAFYGRKSRQHCATGDISNVQCSVDATNFAKHYCHGKTWCYAGANSASLSDPCPGISKYMEIEYECKVPPPTTVLPTTKSPYEIAQICENMFSFRSCASTGGLIYIRSAFFGRKSRQPCATGDISNVQCSVDATKFVKHSCHGKSWCYAGGNSASLSDPCPGISKYLEIVYECKAPSYFTTGPPTAPPTPPVPQTIAPVPTVSPDCGISYAAQSRIVGGEDATPGKWPWQVAIYKDGTFICGGSLINAQWIVSATHCFEDDPSPSSYYVVLGEHDRSRTEGTEVRKYLDKIVLHPGYSKKITYNNDIAVLKMASPVIFNRRIAPVCLPRQGTQVQLQKQCYVSGWGWVAYPGYSSNVLQQGMLPTVSKQECIRRLRNSPLTDNLDISDQMLCAGFTTSTDTTNPDTSACRGDSGGPFVCTDWQGKWILQGVVSWGSVRCSDRDRYSVFARVSEFRDFIDTVVRNNGLPTTQAPVTTEAPTTPFVPDTPPVPGTTSAPDTPPVPGTTSAPDTPPLPGNQTIPNGK
eukprot:gene15693-17276_t